MSAFSGLSLAASAYHRQFPWTGVLTGGIVALAGYQLWLADGQFTRLGSDRSHRWVRPLGVALVAVGALLVAFGILASVHRVAATYLTIPATVSTSPDRRVRLDFINPRPDEIATLITARRR
jgi:hypothetical protein